MNIDAGKPVDINLKGVKPYSNNILPKKGSLKKGSLRRTLCYLLAAFNLFASSEAFCGLSIKPDSADCYKITPNKVEFRIPVGLIADTAKAQAEARKIKEFIEQRSNKLLYVIDYKTGLDYLVCGKDSIPISYQLFTDALTRRIENIPDYIKSWDRLKLEAIEKINGEDYLRFKQEPSHGSWLSTRWDQIFNHLKFKPGDEQDEEIMKDIIVFNVKKQYGFDLDRSKIIIKGHRDAMGNWGVFDVLYTGNAPEHIVKRRGSKTTAPGHILIQKNVPIWLRQSDIPLEIILYQILYQTPVNPVIEKPDTAKPDTNKAVVVGDKVLYVEGGVTKVVDLDRFGPYFGIGVEGTNASLGLYAMLVMINNKSDSLWPGPFGLTSESDFEKIMREKFGIDFLVGGEKMKIGLGVAYIVNLKEILGTYLQEITDMNGNIIVINNGNLPVQKLKEEYVSAGLRGEISGNRIGVIFGVDYPFPLNKGYRSKSAEYFGALRFFLEQRDKHKDTHKKKLNPERVRKK